MSVFTRYCDENGDGKLSRCEFTKLLSILGLSLRRKSAERAFEIAEPMRDGGITFAGDVHFPNVFIQMPVRGLIIPIFVERQDMDGPLTISWGDRVILESDSIFNMID